MICGFCCPRFVLAEVFRLVAKLQGRGFDPT
jgi:hypothetical protein